MGKKKDNSNMTKPGADPASGFALVVGKVKSAFRSKPATVPGDLPGTVVVTVTGNRAVCTLEGMKAQGQSGSLPEDMADNLVNAGLVKYTTVN